MAHGIWQAQWCWHGFARVLGAWGQQTSALFVKLSKLNTHRKNVLRAFGPSFLLHIISYFSGYDKIMNEWSQSRPAEITEDQVLAPAPSSPSPIYIYIHYSAAHNQLCAPPYFFGARALYCIKIIIFPLHVLGWRAVPTVLTRVSVHVAVAACRVLHSRAFIFCNPQPKSFKL